MAQVGMKGILSRDTAGMEGLYSLKPKHTKRILINDASAAEYSLITEGSSQPESFYFPESCFSRKSWLSYNP